MLVLRQHAHVVIPLTSSYSSPVRLSPIRLPSLSKKVEYSHRSTNLKLEGRTEGYRSPRGDYKSESERNEKTEKETEKEKGNENETENERLEF